MFVAQQVAVHVPSLRWYRVVAVGQNGLDVRHSVRASSPDAALRAVMGLYSMRFTPIAFIWRLFSHARPSRRCNVRCRVSVVRPL